MKPFLKIIVANLLAAEARLVLKRYRPRIVAITGSVGKTSTKDAVYAVLSQRAFVRKSEKSFNSEIGVPLTILGKPNAWTNPFAWLSNLISGLFLIIVKHPYPAWLVLEVGADRPGDIENIARWLKPDICIVTRLAPIPVHVEFFGSPEAIVKEKAKLVEALKDDGVLILSQDDDDVLTMKNLVRAQKVVTFGFSPHADVSVAQESFTFKGEKQTPKPVGMTATLAFRKEMVRVGISGTIGRQPLYAALAAAAVEVALGGKLADAGEALSDIEGPPGRMRLLDGVKDTVIIDDTYNSSPVAAREALDALARCAAKGRKIAVLGDMLELGRFSVGEHKSIGAYAAARADFLVTVGVRSRNCADGALDAGLEGTNILQFDDARQAGKAVENLMKPGDTVLVKGSQGMRMERAVEEIMAHPEEKERLLVRQEREWMKR